jgi:hypothetical protein
MSAVDRAWDIVKDRQSPEAEALRAIFGTHHSKVLVNARVAAPVGDATYEASRAIQHWLAECFLWAEDAKERVATADPPNYRAAGHCCGCPSQQIISGDCTCPPES